MPVLLSEVKTALPDLLCDLNGTQLGVNVSVGKGFKKGYSLKSLKYKK